MSDKMVSADPVRSELLEKVGLKDEEVFEQIAGDWVRTGYPKPIKRMRLIYEVYDLSIEETYFWVLKFLRHDSGFLTIDKLEDAFAAAEGSAFFGVMQQRIGIQQDKISQFLATVGKMVKELFQMVRELRILDERLAYYQGAESQLEKSLGERRKSDEITLKGMFIDLVQGGAKSAASVYGMARELEFITLPDLFFDAPPFKSVDEMEGFVSKLEFNKKVLEVLSRHLRQFFEWKKRTGEELGTRRKFTLQYLRQHYDIIKMYMAWAKPYLRNVERMSMKEKHSSAPDLISSFEGSMLDIELLASRPFGDFHACVLATFRYRTRPSMKFVQEGYQRGPVHQGEMEMNLRSYVWTAEQIEKYKKLKDQEELALMRTISGSVNAAMEALGGELEKYLEQAGEEIKKKEEKKENPRKTLMEKLFGDFMPPQEARQKEKKPEKKVLKGDAGKAKGMATGAMFNCYKNFKKAHQMIMW
ncbi:MAG: hypothetical protein ABIA37_03685 [Candidatus Woesearchaeota archaeon]